MKGHPVAQSDETLRYKSAARGFESRWGHSNFSLTFLPAALWGRLSLSHRWVPGVFLGCKGGRCLVLTNLPHSCLEILRLSTSCSLEGLSRDGFTLAWSRDESNKVLWKAGSSVTFRKTGTCNNTAARNSYHLGQGTSKELKNDQRGCGEIRSSINFVWYIDMY